MSLSDRKKSRKGLVLAAVIAGLANLAACTVEPLHGRGNDLRPGTTSARAAEIDIQPVTTREAQQVRNHLVFLLNGGARQPGGAPYTLVLDVTSRTSAAAIIQATTKDNEPTAGVVTLTAVYLIKDAGNGTLVSRGKRAVSASYDRPGQEFASYRAERDAVDRAARELAEFLRLAILTDLGRNVPAN